MAAPVLVSTRLKRLVGYQLQAGRWARARSARQWGEVCLSSLKAENGREPMEDKAESCTALYNRLLACETIARQWGDSSLPFSY